MLLDSVVTKQLHALIVEQMGLGKTQTSGRGRKDAHQQQTIRREQSRM